MANKPSKAFQIADILSPENRGLLLDIIVFIVNLFLMRMLMGRFVAMLKAAMNDNPLAEWSTLFFVFGIFFLPPIGAILKRRQYHLRKEVVDDDDELKGCLFHPIFYLVLTLLIVCMLNAFALAYLYPNGEEPKPGPFLGMLFGGIVLAIVNTWLVFRMFSKPQRPPWIAFFATPGSALLGDICLYVNMLLYQLVWNLLALDWMPRPNGIEEVVGRTGILLFISLLIYFPPRMFYLAEDIHKRRTWIMILVANLPILFKVLIGSKAAN